MKRWPLDSRGKTVGGGTVSVDYEKELDALDELVRRIEYILGNRSTYPKHVEDIQSRIKKYREKIMEIMNSIDRIDGDLQTTDTRVKDGNNEISKLRSIYERLRILVEEQIRNLTVLKDKIPGESYNLTQRSLEKSNETLDIADDVRRIVAESERVRADINKKLPDYETKKRNLYNDLERYMKKYKNLNDFIARINEILCGPADACGGCNATGCDVCGGSGCSGAVPLSLEALEKARLAEEALWEKERKFEGGVVRNSFKGR